MTSGAAIPASTILQPSPGTKTKVDRARQLDGLRGIAALTVVFCHFYDLFPVNSATIVWKLSPLYILIAGGEAVVLFFVLSGFALHRMYLGSKGAGYGGFAVRRTIRIYGPYVGALALAIAADYLLSHGYRSHFSLYFNRIWTLPIRWSDIWAHVMFLGVYNNATFNTAFWSLVHEMRISLIFPLLYLLAAGKAASRQIAVALMLLVAGTFATATFARNTDLGQSVHFAGLFILGIFVSERKTRLAEWYRSLAQHRRVAFAIISVILFYYGRLISHAFPTSFAGFLDLPVGAGATGILVLAFSSRRIGKVLLSKPVSWLGDVSYSLYLIHGTILFGLVNLLNLQSPHLSLLLLYVPLALFAAGAFNAAVEKPLLKLSRKLTATA